MQRKMQKQPVNRINKWRSLHIFAEAWLWLGLMRIAILCMPFEQIARRMGLQLVDSEPADPGAPAPVAEKLGWAVRAAARRTPWKSACLAQALACAMMLKRRSQPGMLYLGVRRDEGNAASLLAHAWLRLGERILTGAGGHNQYTIVARFHWQR
jgi:hypothetical protein